MSRKIELVFAALFALFFIFWLTFACQSGRVRTLLSADRIRVFRSKSWLPYLLLPLAGMVVASTAIWVTAPVVMSAGSPPPATST